MVGIASNLRTITATTTTLERHQHDVKTVRELCGVVSLTMACDVWVVAWSSRLELVDVVGCFVATTRAFQRAASASVTTVPTDPTETLTRCDMVTFNSSMARVFAVVGHCRRHVNGCDFGGRRP